MSYGGSRGLHSALIESTEMELCLYTGALQEYMYNQPSSRWQYWQGRYNLTLGGCSAFGTLCRLKLDWL